MKKRWPLITALCICIYLALILLLLWAESTSPDASIVSFSDALWYSAVTITTVGYGDLYPVTPAGQSIGFIFLMMSTGLLTLLISLLVSLLLGSLLPRLRLYLYRKRNWYIFTQVSDSTLALAEYLSETDPKAFLIFFGKKGSFEPRSPANYFENGNITLLKRRKANVTVFCMTEDGLQNHQDALEARKLGWEVYCQTEFVPNSVPDGLSLFNQSDNCARLYWQKHPLTSNERQIIIIGDGTFARKLLERSLMINVRQRELPVHYHVFGSWQAFQYDHHQLCTAVSINCPTTETDSLCFHEQLWNYDPELIKNADRIILCSDDDGENLAILSRLRCYFVMNGTVHTRTACSIEGEKTFGSTTELCTPELIMKQKLNYTAVAMHEIYRRSSESVPQWQELSEFLRQSNIAAADHLLTKIRILTKDESVTTVTPSLCGIAYRIYTSTKNNCINTYRELEHRRWVRFHALHNWIYAPQRDDAQRCHPMLKPFHDLPESEQAKDDFGWELLNQLAQENW